MSEPVSFFVFGVPAPQGSHTAVRCGDKAVLVPGSSTAGRLKHATWRNAVSAAAATHLEEHGQRFGGPTAVELHFQFAPVKSAPYRFMHTQRPDVDKITRATLDSLVAAGLLADDSRVCRLSVTKHYSMDGTQLGCAISLIDLSDEEAAMSAMAKAVARDARKKRTA